MAWFFLLWQKVHAVIPRLGVSCQSSATCWEEGKKDGVLFVSGCQTSSAGWVGCSPTLSEVLAIYTTAQVLHTLHYLLFTAYSSSSRLFSCFLSVSPLFLLLLLPRFLILLVPTVFLGFLLAYCTRGAFGVGVSDMDILWPAYLSVVGREREYLDACLWVLSLLDVRSLPILLILCSAGLINSSLFMVFSPSPSFSVQGNKPRKEE